MVECVGARNKGEAEVCWVPVWSSENRGWWPQISRRSGDPSSRTVAVGSWLSVWACSHSVPSFPVHSQVGAGVTEPESGHGGCGSAEPSRPPGPEGPGEQWAWGRPVLQLPHPGQQRVPQVRPQQNTGLQRSWGGGCVSSCPSHLSFLDSLGYVPG